ncbi:lasso RiPP family leader peptide-containing protein [Streptomyces roseifaciens]|uniref:lasso RiPP family leader peptide-containing protein n=1 Tax=Streptomyces roseifaciens TaxID=1488406 RepID=UPI000B2853F7|nr:lasso RiPP family leader peptide-containing protein [Streptomyces roseifaciens]
MADLQAARSVAPGSGEPVQKPVHEPTPTREPVYEPPALVEVGSFSALTLGWFEGNVLEEGGEGLRWWR